MLIPRFASTTRPSERKTSVPSVRRNNPLGLKKLFATLTLSALALPGLATVSWSGVLGEGDPKFNRPANMFGLSFGGTAVAFEVQPFTVAASGDYVFESGQNYDGFILVYGGSFDPSRPMLNLLGGGDDFSPDPLSENPSDTNELLSPWDYDFGAKLDSVANGFGTFALTEGVRYFAVTTAYGNADFGRYTNALGGGPGEVTLQTVPEPASLSLLSLGFVATLARRKRATTRPV